MLVAFTSFLYYQVLGNTTLKEEQQSHRIHVQEFAYHNKDEQVFRIDSADQKIKSIEIKQYALQHALDSLFGTKYYVHDVIVDLEFESKNKDHLEEDFIEVLRKEYKVEGLE